MAPATRRRSYCNHSRSSQQTQEWTPEKIILIVIGVILGIIIAIAKVNTGGHYAGGEGSSHRGGHYENSATGDHYQSHK